MKELSIEEKAKRYDEAFEKLRRLHDDYDTVSTLINIKEELENIFPELKESEDERIRKEIIEFLKHTEGQTIPLQKYNAWLAWLEKKGEQKPKHFELQAGHWYICHRAFCCRADHLTVKEGERFMCEKDGVVKGFVCKEPEKYFKEVCAPAPMEDEQKLLAKVEPKFKVGDWVVNTITNEIEQVIEVTDYEYICSEHLIVSFNNQHLLKSWTIENAKDGDILVDYLSNVCIYQEPSTKLMYHSYCYGNHKCFIDRGGSHGIVGSYPATKEQCELLFQKMKEAGYEWDADKKELKKIHVIDEGKAEMDYCFTKMMNGEKVKPQSPTPMSYGKELEARMHEACNKFDAPNTDPNRYSAADLFYAGVKSERDLNTHAWSEEDKGNLLHIKCIIDEVWHNQEVREEIGHSDEELESLWNWLDNIWQRVEYPQSQWKPSDEQMNTLEHYMHTLICNKHKEILFGLYNDLKKIMEEYL